MGPLPGLSALVLMEHPSTPPRSSLHGTWILLLGPQERALLSSLPSQPPHSPDSVSPVGERLWPAPSPGKPDPTPGTGLHRIHGLFTLPSSWGQPAQPAPSSVRPCGGEAAAGSGPRGAPGSLAAMAHIAHISNPACVPVDVRPQPALPACARPRAEPPQALTPDVLSRGAARCSWGLALIPDHPAASSTCSAIPRLPRVPGPQSGYCFLTETPGEPLPRVLQALGTPCLPPWPGSLGVVSCPPLLLGGPWPPLPGLTSAPSPPGHPAIPAKDLRPWVQPASSSPPVSRGNPTSWAGQPRVQCRKGFGRSMLGTWAWLTPGH